VGCGARRPAGARGTALEKDELGFGRQNTPFLRAKQAAKR